VFVPGKPFQSSLIFGV